MLSANPSPAGGCGGGGAPHIGGIGGSSPQGAPVDLTTAYSNTNDHVTALRSALNALLTDERAVTQSDEHTKPLAT
jgi:hypothetical protein